MTAESASTASTPHQDTVRSAGALGRYFSYFSHRVFVTYRPVDLHNYLERLFDVTDEANTATANDAEILRWVMLHRSRLNPLSLNREIEALRNEDDSLSVAAKFAGFAQNRIDLTLQFAVELALADPDLAAWIARRPRMRQTLLDAAYYLSAYFERDQNQQGSGRASDELDMGDGGRPAFRQYLLHRMNLYANESEPVDDDAALRWREERRAIEDGALGEQDLRRLYLVAQSVAETLARTPSRADLKARWRTRSDQLAKSMPVPSDFLYDSLMIGPDERSRVLRPVDRANPACMVFRWQFLPSGQESLDRSRHEIIDEGSPLAHRLDAIGKLLDSAAHEPTAARDDPDDVMRRLVEDHHLMRWNDWKALTTAKANLLERTAQASVVELANDVRQLREFLSRASSPAGIESVCRALLCAAAIEGSLRAPQRSHGLSAGLDALTRGLRLDVCQPEEAVTRLRHLHAALTQLLGHTLPVLAESPLEWPNASDLAVQIERAFRAGGGAAQVTTEDYWLAVADRVTASHGLSPTAIPPPASLPEIRGWLSRSENGRIVDLDLNRMTLRRWTSVLRHALNAERSASAPPLWMAAHALERLGARSLDDEAQQKLLDQQKGDVQDIKRMRDEVSSRALWQGLGQQHRAAIVISTAGISVTDAWSVPPTAGLVLVATAPDAMSLFDRGFGESIAVLGTPLRLAIESPAPATEELQRLTAQASTRAGPTELVWIHRAGQTGRRTPQLIDPATPAELWSVTIQSVER